MNDLIAMVVFGVACLAVHFTPFSSILNWYRHRFGSVTGTMRCWRRRDGIVMLGFECDCGEMHAIHPAPDNLQPWVSGMVECEDCKKQWVCVRSLGICLLECPECGHMTRAKEIAAQ